MSVVYVQNFDSLSTGNLDGQDSWTLVSSLHATVSTDAAYSSPNGVKCAAGAGVYRDCSNQTSGTQYVVVRLDTLGSNGDGSPGKFLAEAGVGKVYLKWQNSSGNKFQNINGGSYEDMFTGTLTSWYIIEINFNNSTDTYTYRYKVSGGTFSSTSASKNYNSVATNINRVYIEQDAGSPTAWLTYMDSYSATDPTPATGPTNVKTWDGVTQSTGIKTYEDVALASVKSVNGIT